MFWKSRKKENDSNPDRKILMERDDRDLDFISDHWPPQNKLVLGITLATDWRVFLNQFGSAQEFGRLPKNYQMEHLQKLLGYSASQKAEADNLRQTNSNKSFEALCGSFSARFLGSYVICLMENDRNWESQLALKLDWLLRIGWSISMSTFPLPSDEKHYPLSDPTEPHTLFLREFR